MLCKLNSRTLPPDWDCEANANCSQILPYTVIYRRSGKNRNRQWSFRGQKSVCAGASPRTPLGELTALPRTPSWWGSGSQPFARTPPRLGLLGLDLLIALPWIKILQAPMLNKVGSKNGYSLWRLYYWFIQQTSSNSVLWSLKYFW